MTPALIAFIGSLGLVLVIGGIPRARAGALRRRTEPYLSGLRGEPSRLLTQPANSGSVARTVGAALRRLRGGDEGDLAARLAAAGSDRSVDDLRLEQLTWGIAATVAAWGMLMVAGTLGADVEVRVIPALGAASFLSGWLGRDRWLTYRIQRRQERLRAELPTAMDLITLSIMAGESVPAAFERTGRVMGRGIGEEFEYTVGQIRAGASVVDALELLKNRLPDRATARFVDALRTGIERGAPLADVLRAQAEDARESRRQHLLELGGRREVLMLLPVVFLILPVVVAFALFPGLMTLDLLVP